MFDIAFSELIIIGVVTLVVVGPKRLPTVARVAGRTLGQFNRYVSQVKSEVRKEMERSELAELRKEFEANVGDIKSNVDRITQVENQVGLELSHLENTIQKEIHDVASAQISTTTTTPSLNKPNQAQ